MKAWEGDRERTWGDNEREEALGRKEWFMVR